MRTHFFAWLGSKRARKQGVSDQGSLLDEAARLRLPVPNGGILLDIFYRLLHQEELLFKTDSGLELTDPTAVHDLLYRSIRFPKLDQPVLLRSPASDSPAIEIGPYTLESPADLAVALSQFYTAMERFDPELRRDILVITAVPISWSGTAVSHASGEYDQIEAEHHSHTLPRLGRWRRPAADQPPHLQRLQQLLRGLRRALGDNETWRIAWRDDGQICWLVKIERNIDPSKN
jgi:hypothetical protein